MNIATTSLCSECQNAYYIRISSSISDNLRHLRIESHPHSPQLTSADHEDQLGSFSSRQG